MEKSVKEYNEKKWNTISSYMNDEIREDLHVDLAPCTMEEFLTAYCNADPDFEIFMKREFGLTLENFWNDEIIYWKWAVIESSPNGIDQWVEIVSDYQSTAEERAIDIWDHLTTQEKRKWTVEIALVPCQYMDVWMNENLFDEDLQAFPEDEEGNVYSDIKTIYNVQDILRL